jgi:RNA recognition motif-containing protein
LLKYLTLSFAIVVSYSVCDLYVGQIPGSVTRNQLLKLFPQATSINYRQGKITRDRVKLGYEIDRRVTHNILFVCFIDTRFAFLHFDDIQSANQVMDHSDSYYIDNQHLSLSYKLFNKTNTATNYSGLL